MLQALGAECVAENGLQVAYGAYGLKQLKHMTVEKFMPELKECEFSIICDVGNTLTGKMVAVMCMPGKRSIRR